MPNWCGNYITIEGKSSDVVDCIKAMKGNRACYAETDSNTYSEEYRDKVVYTFNAHAPVPEEIKAKSYNEAGYSWQNQFWGTKWDCLEDATLTLDAILEEQKLIDKDEIVSVDFGMSTAWGPASGWLYYVAEKHPALTFKLSYEESGCECYGTYWFSCDEDGQVGFSHDTYETEAEYIWAVDCEHNLEDTVDILIDRHDWHEDLDDFIEAMEIELEFAEADMSDELWEKIKSAGAEMYKDEENEEDEEDEEDEGYVKLAEPVSI